MARASDLVFDTTLVPVDGPPEYYPEAVAGFEAPGFRRVGGLLADLTDAEVEDLVGGYAPDVPADLRRSARIPETVLTASDAWAARRPGRLLAEVRPVGAPAVRGALAPGRTH